MGVYTSIFHGTGIVSTGARRYASSAWLSTVSLWSDWFNCQLCWAADVEMSWRVVRSIHDVVVDGRWEAVITDDWRLTPTTPQQQVTISRGGHCVALTTLHSLQHRSCLTCNNNNNPFNGPLSTMTQVSRYQKNIHSLTPCLCGYHTISLINVLYFLRSIASSLHICQVWQSFSITSL